MDACIFDWIREGYKCPPHARRWGWGWGRGRRPHLIPFRPFQSNNWYRFNVETLQYKNIKFQVRR